MIEKLKGLHARMRTRWENRRRPRSHHGRTPVVTAERFIRWVPIET